MTEKSKHIRWLLIADLRAGSRSADGVPNSAPLQ
jgi:hypothetical protein